MRLLNAKLLLAGGLAPSEVCTYCGFGDYANFYRAFRAAYGETFANHDGPVVMRISTTRPLAKGNTKYWEGRADLGKPDWDTLGKLDCAALDMGAVTKRPRSPYGTKPRIDIHIEYFVEEYVKEKK